MSRASGEQSSRPKIFENWPKNPTKLYQNMPQQRSRQINKKQSLRSQETLYKSLMTLTNINHFLSTKKKMQQNIRVSEQNSSNCRMKLLGLGMESGKQFDISQYEQAIKSYYFIIRKQSMFLREAQGFRYANLANYDSKLTGVKFIKVDEESHKSLLAKMQEIQQKRMKLQEALVIYQQGIQPSQILSNQYQLESCLEDLNQSISNQKLTELHYLMLYQIKGMNEQFNQFQKYVADDKKNYATYEALCDSMNLMAFQRKEMKNDRKSLQTSFERLNLQTAPTIVPSIHQSLPILMKNQAVYESNMDLLARYNAETNLNQYASRRKKYSSQVSKQKEQLEKWKQKQESCSYLYSKQQILDNYNKTRAIQNNQRITNRQKQQLKQAYLDALNCRVPTRANRIQNYKASLLQEFGNTMERSGINIPEGTKLLVSNMANSSSTGQEELQKYFDFFMQLKQQPIKDKVPYLLNQKNSIQALIYQLNQSQSNSRLVEQYRSGLHYCAAIAEHSTTFQDDEYIQNTQLISKNRWTGLPIGFNSFLAHYTCDIFLKNQAEKYVRELENKMKGMEDKIYIQLQGSGSEEEKMKDPELELSLTPEERRCFFFKYYNKFSNYSEKPRQKLMDTYWNACASHIINAYLKSKQRQRKQSNVISQVNKKDFFTFKTLVYLSTSGGNLKINNFADTIDYYLDYLAKYQMYRFDQNQMYHEIIKQRIFIKFIKQKIDNNKLNLQEQLKVMKKLNEACILLYQINDNRLLANKDDLNVHFQYCIKLQIVQNQLLLSLASDKGSFLVNKMKNLVKSMKKDLIVFGSHLNLDELQLLVNTEGKLKNIQRLNTLPLGFGLISATYINCQNALQTISNISQHNYTKSDVVSLAVDKSKSLYLAQLEKKSKDQLLVLKPKFNQIIQIFQCGVQNDNDKKLPEVKANKLGSKFQGALNDIIRKLKKMA